MVSPAIYAIATLDTKGEELSYVRDKLAAWGVAVRCIDISTQVDASPWRASLEAVAPEGDGPLSRLDRGQAVVAMAQRLTQFLSREASEGRVAGVLGLGGSGGTAMISQAMRQLPIGLPKVLVSTVASGQTAPYIEGTDLVLFPSVVDIAGLNSVSRTILGNAANALAGMVQRHQIDRGDQLACGMTMFGVTTPCVTAVRQHLEAHHWQPMTFHATGTGGRAMELLVASGMLQGILDITTTEVADEVVGGIFPAGPNRFLGPIASSIPLVYSLGAVDMVNFGALDTVPEKFRNRLLYQHNPQITLMRTTVDENVAIAQWMADRWKQAKGPWCLLIPEGGLSALDAPGKPFEDPKANAALFETLETLLPSSDLHRVERVPCHINDPIFAQRIADRFLELAAIGS